MPYTYEPGTDGCDSTFDVITPEGEFMVSIHYWEMKADAEDRAKLIVDALNAHAVTLQLLEALKLCHEQLSIWVADIETCDLSPEDEEALKKADEVISMVAIGENNRLIITQ